MGRVLFFVRLKAGRVHVRSTLRSSHVVNSEMVTKACEIIKRLQQLVFASEKTEITKPEEQYLHLDLHK